MYEFAKQKSQAFSMPTAAQWTRFLTGCTFFIGSGLIFINNFIPSDEKFVSELSPELKAEYYRTKALRERAFDLMQKKTEETRDKPAWLQGPDKMRKFQRDVFDEARRELENEAQSKDLDIERRKLQELAKKESGR